MVDGITWMKTCLVVLLMVTGLGASAGAASTAALPFRVAWATRAARPPVLDGKITAEDGWVAAPPLTDFMQLEHPDKPSAPTEGRLLYDDEALYVAVRLDGPGRGAIEMDATERDGAVNGDDCVHLFIVPPDAPPLRLEPQPTRWYFHLTVNALGTQRDAIGYKGKSWWNGQWTAKTTLRDDGWTVEMRIPFATLGVDGPTGEAWGFNLCRRYSSAEGTRHSNWSPAEHWYSFPERYGRIVFGDRAPARGQLAKIFVQRELDMGLSRSAAGIRTATTDLGTVPESTPARSALITRLKPLSERTEALRGRAAGLGPAEAARARVSMGQEVDTLLRDVWSAQRAAQAMRLRAEAPAGWPFVVLGGPAITDVRFEHGKPFPPAFQPTDRLSLAACRGEYEPVTFVLYATEKRADVSIAVTSLDGPEGTIPADAVNLHVIKYWFQNGDFGKPDGPAAPGGVLVPELLLKDDGLVVVDHARKKNYIRTTQGLVDISDPTPEFNVEGNPAVDEPRLLHLAPRDADELQPFTVAADEIKQVFVTVHVPPDARAGAYRGSIRVAAPGAGTLVLPLLLAVLPFDLAPAPIDYSLYTRCYLVDRDPVVPVWSDEKTEAQYRAEMANLLAHGIANPMVGDTRFEKFVRAMRIREEVGMPRGHIYHQGIRIPRDELDSDEALASFKQRVARCVAWARENGYGSYYVYGIDEADPLLPRQRRWMAAAHDVGAKVFVAVEDDAGFFDVAGDILDLPIMSGPVQPHVARRVQGNGHRIGIYAFPQVNWDKPEIYRRNYGVRLWQAGYDVEMTYAYQHSFGHIWNDFDSRHHKDFCFAYPTANGVIDTLCFEGLREAVDDARYVATLLAAAERAKKDPLRRAAAVEAEGWARSVDPAGDLDVLRRGIVARILELKRPD